MRIDPWDTDNGTAAKLILLPQCCIEENQVWDHSESMNQNNRKAIKRWTPQKGGQIPSFFFRKPSKDSHIHYATSRGLVSGSLVSSFLILRVPNWHRWCNLGTCICSAFYRVTNTTGLGYCYLPVRKIEFRICCSTVEVTHIVGMGMEKHEISWFIKPG